MAWKVKLQKRQRRGQKIVGARLVFDNDERRRLPNGDPNPDYRSEEKVWSRDSEQSPAEFRAMIVTERDAWLAHYNREASGEALTEVDL